MTDAMKWIETQSFNKPLVHIIDREADSIGHIRQWEEEHINWLTRARKTSGVEYQGESMQCSKGRAGLGIRKWSCTQCGTTHDRDINAAKNILRLGHQTLAGGIPFL